VHAKAPGHRDWQKAVQMQTEGATVDVILPKLEPLTAEPKQPPADAGMSVQTQVGIAALVIGGAGVIAGVALGGVAKSKADDADCDADNFCSPDGLSQRDDAVVLGNIGTGVGVAGAAFAILGLTLVLVDAGGHDSGKESGEAGLTLRMQPGGVTFGCSF
jgi:hypothetical protein